MSYGVIKESELLQATIQQLRQAEAYYQSVLEQNYKEAYQIYESDPDYYRSRFPILSRMIGDIQTADVASKVEWAMPSLLRIFLGSDAIVSITGRTSEDIRKAEKIQELINWQITTLNDGFMVFYRWFKDALVTGAGYVKCFWERMYDYYQQVEIIDVALLDAYQNNPSITDFRIEEDYGNGLLKVSYKVKYLKRNQPVLEHVPVWELLYIPDGRSLKECSFVAHRKTTTADYLRRMAQQGIYRNVEEAIAGASEDTSTSQLETLKDPVKRFGFKGYSGEKNAGKRITLYECYTKCDIDGDGLLEDIIITIAGNTILRVQENIYGRPPFFMLSPIPDLHRLGGRGFAHLVGQYQHIKTALIRQMILNLALGNVPRLLVDPTSVHIEDLEQNKLYIRQKPTGNPQPIRPIYTVPAMTNPTFHFLEFMEMQLENESGMTRYSQGLDPRSLNRTATGIQLIMNASQQRLEMIARIFAETGIKELMRFLVELNQRFIDQKIVLRLFNTTLEITPDDLEGDFDLQINTGVGLVAKETTIQTLQQILQLQLQLIQLGVATPKNIYNTVRKLLEELGYKNVNDYITDPMMGGVSDGQGAVLPTGAEGQISEGMLRLLAGGIPADEGHALREMEDITGYGGMGENQGDTGPT